MKVLCKALKTFSSIQVGNCQAGETKLIDDWLARQFERSGMVEILDKKMSTKVIQRDFTTGPAVTNSSLSQAAPASTKKTAKKSKSGEEKAQKNDE